MGISLVGNMDEFLPLRDVVFNTLRQAILTGGLYFLLYKPVKQFMEKREAYYKDLDAQAAAKLAEA